VQIKKQEAGKKKSAGAVTEVLIFVSRHNLPRITNPQHVAGSVFSGLLFSKLLRSSNHNALIDPASSGSTFGSSKMS
jgi:hypothetical protein